MNLIEMAMVLGITSLIGGGAMTLYGQAQQERAVREGRAPSTYSLASATGSNEVNVGFHKVAGIIDNMELDEACPASGDYVTSACRKVGQFRVRRDMDGSISVAKIALSSGGREEDNEVMRIVSHEPYLNNDIAASKQDAVKRDLALTFENIDTSNDQVHTK